MDWSPFYPGFVEPSSADTYGKNEAQSEAEAKQETVVQVEAPTKNTGDIRRLTRDVEVADIGCGFGGLLVALAPKLPDTLMLGSSFHFDLRL
jgi:tRNA (guanine-N7-)-methyltransferase